MQKLFAHTTFTTFTIENALILWYFLGGYWVILIGELLYAASKAFFSGIADGYIYDLLKSKGLNKHYL